MRTRPRHGSQASGAWLLACCMLFVLPLQGLASVVATLLGPVHFHVDDHPAPAGASGWSAADASPMSGWQDFRRVDHVTDAAVHVHAPSTAQSQDAQNPDHTSAHGHAFSGLGRHHHAVGDASVLVLGADDHGDSPGSHPVASDMHLLFVAAADPVPPRPAACSAAAWTTQADSTLTSCDGRRLDRPPKA